jgi:4-amino-4-deoxy-L-arabinose transferase-like glycosyltransferase
VSTHTITTVRRRRLPSTWRRLGERPGAVVVVALTVLAALLRLTTLSQQSFWLDEGYTQRLLHMPFGQMLRTVPNTESTPYLYYAVAWVWTRAFGFIEYGVRSLSALAGIATVPVVYLAARWLAGRRAGAVAGLLVAVSPVLVWFSQEARSYSLAVLLSALTVLCAAAYADNRRGAWLAGWAVSAGLGLATHYFLVFVIAPELLWLWRAAPRDRRLAGAVGVVVVVGCALLPLAIRQESSGHADYIANASLHTTLGQIPKQLLIGYASPGQTLTGVLVALLVLAGAVVPLVLSPPVRARAAWPLTVGVAAILVPVLLALVGIDFLDTRNLLPALPPLVIAGAIGFAGWDELALAGRRPGWRQGGVGAALAVAAISIVIVVLIDTDARYQRDNWRGVAHALGPATQARVVLVEPSSGQLPMRIYLPGARKLTRPVTVRELDLVDVPSNVQGGGIGTPFRLPPGGRLPPGFTVAGTTYAGTYTVVRLTAPTPTPVDPSEATIPWLGYGTFAPLVQGPSR